MLFPYVYVKHSMEKMQGFIDFIFFAVWCKARTRGAYGLHLFATNAKLYAVMKAFHYSDTQGADFFNTHVESIYKIFRTLPASHIRKLRRWYSGNNDLEKVCANDSSVPLIRYEEIKTVNPELAKQFATFFKGLYEKLDLAAIRKQIGDIDAHYQAFVRANNTGKCPFCGLSDLLGEYHSKREAYDHYLPKALYPFNSINFHNLVPACHHCNSSYKGSTNPAYTPKDPCDQQARRKLFYPFAPQPWRVQVQVGLKSGAIEGLQPGDIALDFGPAELTEQIETWKDVYGIEERYRAKLCAADAKAWLVAMEDEWRWYDESGGAEGKLPEAYLRDLARHAAHSPYADTNFLKHAFLQACAAAEISQPAAGLPMRTAR
ncbi:HNH endonuclease [Rhodanobacter sp. FW102-FHT14D06]|uniref:HNH endonuclease n=2 Tax=unclassified Rhodanobacter TaxID=2621553 RepID=A0AB74UQG0_9GAMM